MVISSMSTGGTTFSFQRDKPPAEGIQPDKVNYILKLQTPTGRTGVVHVMDRINFFGTIFVCIVLTKSHSVLS